MFAVDVDGGLEIALLDHPMGGDEIHHGADDTAEPVDGEDIERVIDIKHVFDHATHVEADHACCYADKQCSNRSYKS